MSENIPRIALFLSYLGGGGADQMIVNLANNFAGQGFPVDLVLGKAWGPHLWKVSDKVHLVDLNSEQSLSTVFALARYLKQVKPSVLLSTLHYTNEIAIIAKCFAGVTTRLVLREANTPSAEARFANQFKRRITPFLIRCLYPWADEIIGVSQGVSDDIAQITGLPRERIHTIYNPAVTPQIFEKAQEPIDHPWFAPGEPPVILGVGKLQRQKDFPTLIRAFAEVRQTQPARLLILGWGPERSQIEALIRDLGLEVDVAMPEHAQNPYAYMARSAVFVLSSAWEGLPNVLIEALAIGVPVVSTDCHSGPSEILGKGQYGALTSVGDSQAMAQAILRVLAGDRRHVDPFWLDQFRLETATQRYLGVLGFPSPKTIEPSRSLL